MTKKVEKKISFEAKYKELEEIVAFFEKNEGDLDEGIAQFEKGMALAKELREKLEAVENTVKIVKEKYKQDEENS